MSLLMEALKKAERAKQEQAAQPALSADTPDANAPAQSKSSEAVAVKAETASAPVPERPDRPAHEPLALTLQADELAAPSAQPEFPPLIDDLEKPKTATARTAQPVPDQVPRESAGQGLSLVDEPAAPVVGNAQPDIPSRPIAVDTAPAVVVPAAQTSQARPAQQTEARPNPPQPDLQPMSQPVTANASRTAPAQENNVAAARQQAKTIFAAKQRSGSRKPIIIVVLALTLCSLVGASYFYAQLMPQNTITAIPPASPMPVTPPATGTTAVVASATTPTTSAADPGIVAKPLQTPAVEAPVEIAGSSAVPSKDSAPLISKPSTKPVAAAPSATRAPVAMLPPTSSPANTDDIGAPPETRSAPSTRPRRAAAMVETEPIQIQQGTGNNQVSPVLGSAYQAFMNGDYDTAQKQYQTALRQEPNNRDALLGAAAVALNRRQPAQASAYYMALLELDPLDPDAMAGLVGLHSQADPAQSESRLKKILTHHPQAAALHFALGNLYAQQARWADAQQAYFHAYGSAPGNADYAFNLAVSLDRLDQGRLALDYYRRALAQGGQGNFDRNAVQNRINELQAVAEN